LNQIPVPPGQFFIRRFSEQVAKESSNLGKLGEGLTRILSTIIPTSFEFIFLNKFFLIAGKDLYSNFGFVTF
jgi:hypothetical protein